MPFGYREHRHPVPRRPHLGVGLHPFGDQQGGVTGPGHLRVPQRAHIGGRLEVVTVTVELEPGRVRQRLAGLHAQQRLVAVRGLPRHVVAVVGSQRRDAELAPHLQQAVADTALDLDTVIHQLQEEIVLAEDLLPFGGGLERLLVMAQPQPGLHLARGAARRRDDALGVLGDQFGVHARPLAELTLEGGHRGQLEQVAQPGRVLGDHGHVGVGAATGDVIALLTAITPLDTLGVEARPRRDIGLDADDGLDPGIGGDVVELAGPEHVSVVGHADRRHPQALRLGHHRFDLRGTVQHRVFGVVVQMHEGGTHRVASLLVRSDSSGRVA